MGPKPTMPSSGDLYRSRLDQVLDHRHELFRLAALIDWDRFDQEVGRFYRPLWTSCQTQAADGGPVLSPAYLQPVR
jgi:hypothetical protein